MFSKVEKFVFLSLVFSIPFQKRFFLFGPSPEGERFFEWTSGFLYFTDLLILVLFSLWVASALKGLTPHIKCGGLNPAHPAFWLLLFFGFAFVSLSQAEFVDVGAYRFIKLAEFIFLFFYVASRARTIGPPRRDELGSSRLGIKPILGAFVASGVFQSVLAILQFAKQSSLGLEIFHESTLAIGLSGAAQISVGGVEFIRAYGTFPSPNVLAGFLGICLLSLFGLYLRGGRGSTTPAPLGAMYGISIFLLSFGLALTFSRGVIVFFIVTTILFFTGIFLLEKLKQYRKKAAKLAVLVVVSGVLTVAALWPEVSARFMESSVGEPAIQERFFFNEVGVDTVRQNYPQLFFGVGMGNFVSHYMQYLPGLAPHLYQPVHNVFILVASEIGILGLIAFVIFLGHIAWKAGGRFLERRLFANFFLYILIFNFLFLILISTYDHYFWTLQQGSLMFWISFGLLAGRIGKYNKVSSIKDAGRSLFVQE